MQHRALVWSAPSVPTAQPPAATHEKRVSGSALSFMHNLAFMKCVRVFFFFLIQEVLMSFWQHTLHVHVHTLEPLKLLVIDWKWTKSNLIMSYFVFLQRAWFFLFFTQGKLEVRHFGHYFCFRQDYLTKIKIKSWNSWHSLSKGVFVFACACVSVSNISNELLDQ